MKKCPNCNAEIQKNARFCLHCMTSFETKEQVIIPHKKKNKLIFFVCIFLGMISICVVALLLSQGKNDEKNSSGEMISHNDESVLNEYSDKNESSETLNSSQIIESTYFSDETELSNESDNSSEPDTSD
jgi:hypothetical protein